MVGVRRWHNHTPLEAGMVVSNEPGYYEDTCVFLFQG